MCFTVKRTKTTVEQKLDSLGCILVFTGVCALGYLALSRHWGYSIAGVGLLGVGWVIGDIRSKRRHGRVQDAFNTAFALSGRPFPHLEVGSSYGYPTFKLTFTSKAERTNAQDAGCIDAFKHAVQLIYLHYGSKENPFDADRAVWSTYEDKDSI
jgi:hypothetical protein